MVEYTCNKCLRIFDHKHNYLYHINRKRSCLNVSEKIQQLSNPPPNIIIDNSSYKPENNKPDNFKNELKSMTIYNPQMNEPICIYCNKLFMNNSHRNRHMNNNCPTRKKYQELIKILDFELENLYLENRFLRGKYIGLFGEKYLFAFGTERFVNYNLNLVADCIRNPYKGIPEFIEAYHFNSIERRYNNIRIKNPKGSHLEIYNGTNWVIETKDNVIQTLLRTYKDIVDSEVEKMSETIPYNFIKNYNEFSENVDFYISHLIYDSDILPNVKRICKPIYCKIFSSIELMLINIFRKEISHKIEEETLGK